jgi:Spy/CpxP family protein refolding chaperone
MKDLRFAVITLFFAACVLDASAQSARPDPQAVAQRIEQAKERLNLTPEQEAQLRPVMEERVRKLQEIRGRYAGDNSRKARRGMMKEARPVQEDYETKVKAILTEPQIAEWETMRKEARNEMKERYRNNQSSGDQAGSGS